MERYKFRGKSIEPGYPWVYGYLSNDGEITEYILRDATTGLHEPIIHYVEIESVGQYTGLKDKNGREIYEGDIVKGGVGSRLIVWKNGAFHVQHPDYEKEKDLPSRPIWMDCLSPEGIKFEIIGNIHEQLNKG